MFVQGVRFFTHTVWINKGQTGYRTLSDNFWQELKEDRLGQEIISSDDMYNCLKQLRPRTVIRAS